MSHFKTTCSRCLILIVWPPSTCHTKPQLTIGWYTPPSFFGDKYFGYVSLYNMQVCHCWLLKTTPSPVTEVLESWLSTALEFNNTWELSSVRTRMAAVTTEQCTLFQVWVYNYSTTTTLHESCLWQLSSGPIIIMAATHASFVCCNGFDWAGTDGVMSTPQEPALAYTSNMNFVLFWQQTFQCEFCFLHGFHFRGLVYCLVC